MPYAKDKAAEKRRELAERKRLAVKHPFPRHFPSHSLARLALQYARVCRGDAFSLADLHRFSPRFKRDRQRDTRKILERLRDLRLVEEVAVADAWEPVQWRITETGTRYLIGYALRFPAPVE